MYDNDEPDMAALRAAEEQDPRQAAPSSAAVATTKDGFGSHEVTVTGEVSQTALAARVTAEVQAMCVMASRFPRNMDSFRVAILENCSRKRFAETTRFALPRGNCQECKGRKKIDGQDCWKCDGTGKNIIRGWTIRFAEAAFQDLRNVEIGDCVVADDPLKRTMRLTLTDFQRNTRIFVEYVTEKTVERKFLKEGQRALSARPNSYGDTVYLLPATEEDFRSKLGSNRSKAFRDAVLRLLPPDIKEDALDKVTAAMASPDADPLAARKKIVDGFAKVGVKPQALVDYLGHDLDQCTPAELQTLREFYQALKDGETTWAAIIDDPDKAAADAAKKAAEKTKKGTEGVKDALREAAGKPKEAPASAEQTPAATTATPTAAAPAAEAPKPKSKLKADVLEKLTKLAAQVYPGSSLADAIDTALGNAGITDVADVSAGMAKDAISSMEATIAKSANRKAP